MKNLRVLGTVLEKEEQLKVHGGFGNCGCPTPQDEESCEAIEGIWIEGRELCLYRVCYCNP